MDIELQRNYEARIRMFGDTAWKELIEDIAERFKSTNDLSDVQDEKTLHFKRGELSIMRWLLSIEQITRDAYEELQHETNGS